MNITFTGKIPIAVCQVQKRSTKENIPVTFFEYDCKDIEDAFEVENSTPLFNYTDTIAQYMRNKIKQIKNNEEPSDERFFGLSSNDGKLIGIAQTSKTKRNLHLDFIETDFTNYKNTGRNLIALICKYCIKDKKDKNLVVDYYAQGTHDFYSKKCGFEPCKKPRKLKIGKKGMKKLIEKAQAKSNAPFQDKK